MVSLPLDVSAGLASSAATGACVAGWAGAVAAGAPQAVESTTIISSETSDQVREVARCEGD